MMHARLSSRVATVIIGHSDPNCNATLHFVLRNSLTVMGAINIFNLCVHTYLAARCFLLSLANV